MVRGGFDIDGFLSKIRQFWLQAHMTVLQNPSISQPSYNILKKSERNQYSLTFMKKKFLNFLRL